MGPSKLSKLLFHVQVTHIVAISPDRAHAYADGTSAGLADLLNRLVSSGIATRWRDDDRAITLVDAGLHRGREVGLQLTPKGVQLAQTLYAQTVDPEEQVRRFVAAVLRAFEKRWHGELEDLDRQIKRTLATATARTGMTWRELQNKYTTVVQYVVVVPEELQRAVDDLAKHHALALLELAAAAWVAHTRLDLDDFHRAALGIVVPPPDDADVPAAAST